MRRDAHAAEPRRDVDLLAGKLRNEVRRHAIGKAEAEDVRRAETLIEDLRRDFTYIVIDSPPLGEYPDAALFARMSDGLVMVVEANDTRRDTARKAKEMLDAGGVSVLGAVLNKRTFPIPEALYRRL